MISEEEFNERYMETLDTIVATMAEEEEIDPTKFYSMVCLLENLRFFGPVLYGAIRSKKE